ncbi:helix-turn-helix domain-containing protein [Robertkochia aurantiaca]|uniref:helix-turn-helix domain-containing protein n=1 Tax=Robertkochia aurantiaca TaxID=2873700 RepID=UPI001CCA7941|nr:helix-turn-helix transcriptional regulator [Robertkochia sp. 3YJGBD-33]
MVNSDEFTTRLEKILEYYGLTASAFADRIGVQRSSLSHLLSGRNKPSLDFVMKTIDEFREVDLYWLLNGKGSFPKSPATVIQNKAGTDLFSDNTDEKYDSEAKDSNDLPPAGTAENNASGETTEKQISRIVIFYSNGTFEEFKK